MVDILLPRAQAVPVGRGNLPRVELARELARRFNNLYGETFPSHDAFNPDRAEVDDLKARYRAGKVGGVEVKTKLAAAINAFLEPFCERRAYFLSHPARCPRQRYSPNAGRSQGNDGTRPRGDRVVVLAGFVRGRSGFIR